MGARTSDELRSLLCGPDGKVCIEGSDEDKLAIERCLHNIVAMETFIENMRAVLEAHDGQCW